KGDILLVSFEKEAEMLFVHAVVKGIFREIIQNRMKTADVYHSHWNGIFKLSIKGESPAFNHGPMFVDVGLNKLIKMYGFRLNQGLSRIRLGHIEELFNHFSQTYCFVINMRTIIFKPVLI